MQARKIRFAAPVFVVLATIGAMMGIAGSANAAPSTDPPKFDSESMWFGQAATGHVDGDTTDLWVGLIASTSIGGLPAGEIRSTQVSASGAFSFGNLKFFCPGVYDNCEMNYTLYTYTSVDGVNSPDLASTTGTYTIKGRDPVTIDGQPLPTLVTSFQAPVTVTGRADPRATISIDYGYEKQASVTAVRPDGTWSYTFPAQYGLNAAFFTEVMPDGLDNSGGSIRTTFVPVPSSATPVVDRATYTLGDDVFITGTNLLGAHINYVRKDGQLMPVNPTDATHWYVPISQIGNSAGEYVLQLETTFGILPAQPSDNPPLVSEQLVTLLARDVPLPPTPTASPTVNPTVDPTPTTEPTSTPTVDPTTGPTATQAPFVDPETPAAETTEPSVPVEESEPAVVFTEPPSDGLASTGASLLPVALGLGALLVGASIFILRRRTSS